MSKPSRKTRVKEALEKPTQPRKKWIILTSVILAVIVAIVGIGYYFIYVRPFQRPIIVVNDEAISMRYFLTRTYLSGAEPLDMMQSLVYELLIKQGAPEYGITVTDEEVTDALKSIARGESETISDSEYNEWFRQQLNATGLTAGQYRDMMYVALLTDKLHLYLAERVPTVTDQAHLYYILLEEYSEAAAAKERIDAGESFEDVAKEVSLDNAAAENGGDLGWMPYTTIDYYFGSTNDFYGTLASSLDVGAASEPLETDIGYLLFMVAEHAEAREVDENNLAILQNRSLQDWLNLAMVSNNVEFHGIKNGYDYETYTWILYQLSNMYK